MLEHEMRERKKHIQPLFLTETSRKISLKEDLLNRPLNAVMLNWKSRNSTKCNMLPTFMQNLDNKKYLMTKLAISAVSIGREMHWSKCIKIWVYYIEYIYYTPAHYLIATDFSAALNKGSGSLHINIKKQSKDADWLNRLLFSALQYLNMILTFGCAFDPTATVDSVLLPHK